MIERTRDWLFEQQRNDGAWEPTQGGISEGAIGNFRGEVLRTTAYVAWAIAESGTSGGDLDKALDYIFEGATATEDVYTLALCANALLSGGYIDRAREVLEWLEGFKKEEDGLVHWASTSQGVTHSRGRTLDIETTAIAAYAFLEANYRTGMAHKALAWLIEQKDSRGTWHSTQATVHAMRALLKGAGPSAVINEPVIVRIQANGTLGKELKITPEDADVFRLISLRDQVKTGANNVTIDVRGEGGLAYQVVATHYVPWAGRKAEVRKELSIDLEYDTTRLKKDDILSCRAIVTYNRPGTAHMTIVDLGIPPGFELMADSLDSIKAKGLIEKYSVTGRQAILYFREIQGGRPVTFEVKMRAKYPVKVKTPSSTVYQYYEPSLRDEAEPVELEIF